MLQKVRILTDGGFKDMFNHVKLPVEVMADVEIDEFNFVNVPASMAHVTTKELASKGVHFSLNVEPDYEWHFFLDGIEAELVE